MIKIASKSTEEGQNDCQKLAPDCSSLWNSIHNGKRNRIIHEKLERDISNVLGANFPENIHREFDQRFNNCV